MPHIIAVEGAVVLKSPQTVCLGGLAAGADVHARFVQALGGNVFGRGQLQVFQKQSVQIALGDVQMGAQRFQCDRLLQVGRDIGNCLGNDGVSGVACGLAG